MLNDHRIYREVKHYRRIFSEEMCHVSEICNSVIKQTTFATIVEEERAKRELVPC